MVSCFIFKSFSRFEFISVHGVRVCSFFFFFFFFFFCLFAFPSAAPMAHGGSQARGPVRAVATGPCQSYISAGSEPRLRPTPLLTATPDPKPTH